MRVVVAAIGVLCACFIMSIAGPARAQDAGGWRSYVLAPPKGQQKPVRVVRITGTVDNPEALVTGEGATTLTYVAGGEPPTITLDFGQVVGGYPQFDIATVTGEPTLRASYSETLVGMTPDGDYAGKARLTRVQQHAIRSPGAFRSRQIEGGQRYMRLALDAPGTVALNEAGIHFTPVRGTARNLTGHFLSSDRLLNRIWYAGVYTVNLNQIKAGFRQSAGQIAAKSILIDGAKRDRRVWSGDILTAGPTVFYSLDTEYVKNSIARIGANPATDAVNRATASGSIGKPGPMPGVCSPHTTGGTPCRFWSAAYSMAYVLALHDYYRYTGDIAFVREQWAGVQRQMAWNATQISPTTGLFVTTDSTGETWNLERFGGELTYVNSVYYMALRDAADLAEAIGKDGAGRYRSRAANVKSAVNTQLWNEEAGQYDLSTSYDLSVVQDANVFAVLSGIASPEQANRAMSAVRRSLMTPFGALNVSRPFPESFRPIISPYIGGFQIRAHFEAGQSLAALDLVRTEWGWMVNTDPGGTAWEKIRPDGRLSSFSSAAHAWSTGATSALSEYVLGASPVTAGWETWKVMPHPEELRFARGEVPTPAGPLKVDWTYDARPRAFEVTVVAPEDTAGSVWVPLYGGEHAVTVDDAIVFTGGEDVRKDGIDVRLEGDYLVVKQQTGRHRYGWTGKLDRAEERRREREAARDEAKND